MDTSGKPHEGWMVFVPATVLLVIVVGVLGGPVQFVNTVSAWLADIVSYSLSWLRNL
jgi:hypothetical protein